jgi:hypothetical protein
VWCSLVSHINELRAFDNRELRRIFVSKTQDVVDKEVDV